MEDIELKKLFAAYDSKLDKMLQVNDAVIDSLPLDKSKKNRDRIVRFRSIEVATFSIIVLLLGGYIANHWGQTHLVISGIIVHLFAIVALVGSIGQVVLLRQIDFSKPIVEIRKKTELVNAHGLLFIKLIFLSTPVWWAYAIVGINVILGVDLYPYLEPGFVQRYFIANFLLVIPIVWAFNKLSHKNLHIKWVRTTIKVFTGSKTMEALEAINEIEEFEK
ncbi:hypothetical protein [Flammeovirga agarivorans]|uniref:Uncharacterized protein n=1 Tax=Flammeovirga agarivorans TaxID=2726742 RepID=A0A7X8XVC7_9BACT|nr:hypothetical protein [Flammeovirga agarivorans]NLR91186.1 hypothetical protein [Flammeovirga agarivorans]